jgi:uncharacterized protein
MHQNEQLMKDAYDAYGRGDLAALTSTWKDDVVWHMRGTTTLAGDYVGAEAITTFLAEAIKISNGTFKLDVTKLFADDDTGIALCRTKATYNGEAFDTLTTHVHRIVDGKVAESWFLFDDAVAINEAQLASLAVAAT